MVRTILVVCLGNTCRSPMAAALLRRALPHCEVSSAGLEPPVGATADPRAARLLAADGADLSAHRAQAIDAAMVAHADLVLVMDTEQREEVETLYPHARGKTHLLCEREQADVPDPYSCSQRMFIIVLGLIKQGVESWSARILATKLADCHREAS